MHKSLDFAGGVVHFCSFETSYFASWLATSIDYLPHRYLQKFAPKKLIFGLHNRTVYYNCGGQFVYRMAPVVLALSALSSGEFLCQCATWMMCWKANGLSFATLLTACDLEGTRNDQVYERNPKFEKRGELLSEQDAWNNGHIGICLGNVWIAVPDPVLRPRKSNNARNQQFEWCGNSDERAMLLKTNRLELGKRKCEVMGQPGLVEPESDISWMVNAA